MQYNNVAYKRDLSVSPLPFGAYFIEEMYELNCNYSI